MAPRLYREHASLLPRRIKRNWQTFMRGNLHATWSTLSSSTPAFRLRRGLALATARGSHDTLSHTHGPGLPLTCRPEGWELTVGVEVHAQLNSDRKLFSNASTLAGNTPNQDIAYFDLALPGSQPKIQKAVLIPALRAALALNCEIQSKSFFDRKHYFYHDQPAGYQITQNYAPFARNGFVRLRSYDRIAPEDGDEVIVGIRQVQLEQDTAKTLQHPSGEVLLDFNRAGHALIEIVTLPQIHQPQTAAACIRKIQQTLECVCAVTNGMELGGLRTDVNVSVRPRSIGVASSHISGAASLGQRTEIKNLSSFKAVENAVAAERDRQIRVLESGGQIAGETRGWSLGSTETRKLRRKEGEVDYRYMPDPDIPPLFIDSVLIEYLRETLPMLPDELVQNLSDEYDIKGQDAIILATLDGGKRLEYFYEIVTELCKADKNPTKDRMANGRLAYNWIVHELGALLTTNAAHFDANQVPVISFVSILSHLQEKSLSRPAARELLKLVSHGEQRPIHIVIQEENLVRKPLKSYDYIAAIESLVTEYPKQAGKAYAGRNGIHQFFVGQMMRQNQEQIDPQVALQVVQKYFKA